MKSVNFSVISKNCAFWQKIDENVLEVFENN